MRFLLAVLAALVLSGCGQSGPLYIPGDPSRIESPPPAEAPAEDEAKENDADRDAGD